MKGEKILVVDDEVHILEACRRSLERSGYKVTALNSGIDALRLLDIEKFDLLLTDVRMPLISGLDILKSFKKKDPGSAAVVITGEGTMDTAVRAIGHGVDGFVIKPFSKNQLLNAVHCALEKVQMARENAKLKSLLPLFEITRNLMTKMDVDELLNAIADIAYKESRASSVSIILKGDDGSFIIGASIGMGSGFDKGTSLRKGEGLAWKVMEGGEPLFLDEDDPFITFSDLMNRDQLSSSLILPLKAEDEIMGVINVSKLKDGDYPHFSEGDLEFMTILAGQAATALKNSRLVEGQRRLLFSTVKSLSAAIDTKSAWTAGHSERVTAYALILGEAMELGGHEMEKLELAGLLHDIGKIGTHEEILNKPGKLTAKEYRELKSHPAAGATILLHVEELKEVIPAIRHHHERFDGSGYPDGKEGNDIPVMARVLAVADAFDAMKADRPYRKGRSMDAIMGEFDRCSGRQFDPRIVDVLKGSLGKIKERANMQLLFKGAGKCS